MKPTSTTLRITAALALGVSLTACGGTGGGRVTTGSSPTATTGAAAGGTSVGANSSLERCASPLGTLAVDDGRDKEWWGSFGAATQITTIEPLIRLAVAQSNCFVITSVGNNPAESKLSGITDKQRNSGEFRAGSNQQKGQRVAADYYLDPRSSSTTSRRPGGRCARRLAGRPQPQPGGARRWAGKQGLGGDADHVRHPLGCADRDLRRQRHRHQLRRSPERVRPQRGRLPRWLLALPRRQGHRGRLHDSYNSMVIALRNYKAQDVKGGLGRGGALKVN